MSIKLFSRVKKSNEQLKNKQQIKSYSYADSTKTLPQKILLEKRRRHQIYTLLDYVLSVITYFDFFSKDTFKIVKYSKYLAQSVKIKNLTSDFLLLPFFDSTFELATVLKSYTINEKQIGEIITSIHQIKPRTLNETKDYLFYKIFNKLTDIPIEETSLITNEVKYSYDINVLFEKAAENALVRFKTPIITPEILFITMMEEKNNKVYKIIKQFLKDDTNWYLLRYQLIKRIHSQELKVKSEIPKSQQYFAYLLKLNLSEFEFNRLIERNLLNVGVSSFRSQLVTHMLNLNIFNLLEKDISNSIRINSIRKYST
jgi:hypothetical protein